MTKSMKLMLVLAVAATALLAVGVGSAAAHGGGGGHYGKASTSSLVTAAAKELGVTRAKLKQAIVDSAVARVDEAVDDGDLEAADADEYKAEADDNLSFAYSISRTKTVASNLGITTAKLNDGFRAARKSLALARIDAAAKAGDLDATEAADRKAELDDADLPGYKQTGNAFGGPGFGDGGGRGGHGHGR